MRRLSLLFLLVAGTAQAADRVAYVERQVVRYEGNLAVVVTEQVATVVSDVPVIVEKKTAPVVAVASTFRAAGPVFNASHNCPTCGRSQFVISGGAKGGYHTHTCRHDGTVWYH